MKRFRKLLIVCVLVLAAGFVLCQSVVHASAITKKCAKCITDKGCAGKVVDDSGHPVGCSKKWFQDACTGTCSKICAGSTATNWCQWGHPNTTCTADTGTFITCGTQTTQPCTGVWSTLCSCTGTVTTVGTCSINYCMY